MKRFRLQFRETSVADILKLEKLFDEAAAQRRAERKIEKAELRKWRQLKHHLA